VRFEWDRAKAVQNIAKHGVSFEEATTAREATRRERTIYEEG